MCIVRKNTTHSDHCDKVQHTQPISLSVSLSFVPVFKYLGHTVDNKAVRNKKIKYGKWKKENAVLYDVQNSISFHVV